MDEAPSSGLAGKSGGTHSSDYQASSLSLRAFEAVILQGTNTLSSANPVLRFRAEFWLKSDEYHHGLTVTASDPQKL